MTDAAKETEKEGNLVFISYAESDRHIADMIYSALASKGIQGWASHRDIAPGLNWPNEISKAITGSKILILVLSSNTQKSRYVNMEVTQAEDENIIIVPFCIEKVTLRGGLKLLLGNRHWINAFPKPQEKHVDQLVETVLKHLGKAPAMPPKNEEKQPEVVKEVIRKEEKKTGKPLWQKRIPIAVSIIILLIAAVFLISQLVKKEGKKEEPAFIKKVKSKGAQVKQIGKDLWEAYYEKYDITMVYIPPGEFMMGQTAEEKKWLIDKIGEKDYNSYYSDETPLHNVYLDGYWIGKYEVTFAQYDRYCNDTKIKKPADRGWGRENRPVINVSWNDAVAYCQWLSQETGLKFNLPTEAQWEKAARGNDRRKYPWGSMEPGKDLANFAGNIGKTTPVGSYPAGASPYGLLDMAGNVWEWCSDRYDRDYYKNLTRENKNKIIKNPIGPDSGSYRVIRGGSWYSYAGYLRCADRFFNGPSYRFFNLGFRLRQDI